MEYQRSHATVDTLVLCTSEAEHRALRAALSELREECTVAGTIVEVGRLHSGARVGIAGIGTGNTATAVLTERMIARFPAAPVLLVGVAGALHTDLAIGDVVVPRKVQPYEGGRETPGGETFSIHQVEQVASTIWFCAAIWKARGRPATVFASGPAAATSCSNASSTGNGKCPSSLSTADRNPRRSLSKVTSRAGWVR